MPEIRVIRPSTGDLLLGPLSSEYLDIHGVLEHALTLADPSKGPPDHILISGPHGLGKTLLAKTFTKRLSERLGYRIPLLPIQCSHGMLESHLMGTVMGIGDETPFILGPLPLSIELANEVGFCVVVVEEIGKLPPEVQGAFNKRTDFQRELVVPALGKIFKLKPDAHVVFLGNRNPRSYAGVYELNDDLRSRFNELEIPYPKPEQEKKILKHFFPKISAKLMTKVIRLGLETRTPELEYQVSTRDLVKLLQNINKWGGDLEVPLTLLRNKFSGLDDRAVVIEKIDQIFDVDLSEEK